MVKRPQHIRALCQQNKMLLKLTQHAQLVEKLNNTLHQVLPLQLSAHCHLANIRGQTLIIHTDNASFASLIRFQAPALCKTFTAEFNAPIHNIDVKVRPRQTTPSQNHSTPVTLPKSAASALQQTANIIDNAELRAALERLANRVKP